MKCLWVLFILGQVANAGNMNYQQENGYYETNDTVYGKHPSKRKVYTIKALETLAVYGATKIFPKYEQEIVRGASSVVWGVIYYDHKQGITMGFKW